MCATCGCSGAAVVRLVTADEPDAAGGHRAAGHPAGAHDDHGTHDHRHQHHDDLAPDEFLIKAPGDSDRTVQLQQKVLAKNDALAQRNREWLRQRGILAVNLMSSPGAGKTTLLERTAGDLAERISISVVEGDQETALDARRIRASPAVFDRGGGGGGGLPSVPEGAEKPVKYPHMFRRADLVLVTKTD